LASIARPATVATGPEGATETAEPISVNAPLIDRKAEMVPDEPLETYKKTRVGETARNCGFGLQGIANAKGDQRLESIDLEQDHAEN